MPTRTAPIAVTPRGRSRSSPRTRISSSTWKGEGTEPTQELNGREALTPVFDDLNRYEATTHFNGQSTVALDGDRATGESYCLAHHLFTEDGERKLMVASLRYLDTFVKIDGAWLFAERKLYVDWTETRSSQHSAWQVAVQGLGVSSPAAPATPASSKSSTRTARLSRASTPASGVLELDPTRARAPPPPRARRAPFRRWSGSSPP